MIKIKARVVDKFDRMKEAKDTLSCIPGCELEVQKNAYHWIVSYQGKEIHYWPTTGKWYEPSKRIKSEYSTRFLAGLLTYLGVEFSND